METRQKRPIANKLVFAEPIPGVELEARDLRLKFVSATHRPGKPTQSYNCHGLTFGSRRAAIEGSADVLQVLKEDGYETVAWDNVLPGDIVIYRYPATQGGEIIHSGIVVQRPPANGTLSTTPIVLSKWGAVHEVIHSLHDCPYHNGTEKFFYRIVR